MGVEWTIGSVLCLISASVFFFFFLRQKIVAAEQYENKKEVVSVEDDSREAEDVLSGVSVLVPPV